MPKGRVYVASRNSHDRLYHRNSLACPYRMHILKGNILYFRSRASAEDEGFRYCKICRRRSGQKKIGEYL